jgi:uncharacterized damage-inducible protein DinB
LRNQACNDTPKEKTMNTALIVSHWMGHRRLSRRTLELFPEDQLFTFSVGNMRPYGKLALEMLQFIPTLKGVVSGEWKWQSTFDEVNTKEALLKAWDDTDSQLLEVWKDVTAERLSAIEADNFWMIDATSNLWKVQYWVDNEIHHRGQGYVYLRALGIEPPAFWER